MQLLKNSEGLSIVQLLISMSVGLLILYSVYESFTIQNRHFKKQELKVEMLQNATIGLDLITRELRMAGYNPTSTLNNCIGTGTATNTPCVGITAAAADSISFTADLNSNGNLTADDTNPNENVTYNIYSSGGVSYLGRTANGVTQPLAMNISNLSYTYYNGSNQLTTNLALIRKIRISLTAGTAAGESTSQPITISADLVPKGLAD